MTDKLKDTEMEKVDGGVIFRTKTKTLYEVYDEETGKLIDRTKSIKLAALSAMENGVSSEIITHEADPDFDDEMKRIRTQLKKHVK